jgi:WD domain, G-beta repeat
VAVFALHKDTFFPAKALLHTTIQMSSRKPEAFESEDAEELLADAEVLLVKDRPGTLGVLTEEGCEQEEEGKAADGATAGFEEEEEGGELAEEEVHDEDGGDGDDSRSVRSSAVPSGPDMSRLQLAGHADSIYCVSVSHSGLLVATGSGDDTAKLWSLQGNTDPLLFTLAGHTESINACAFNSSDTMLATGALDGGIKVWSTALGLCVASLDGPGSDVSFLGWHPKGDVLVAGSADTTVWMWAVTLPSKAPPSDDCAKVEVMQVFAGHEGEVTCGTWSSSGKTLLTGDSTGAVRMWNPKTAVTQQLFSGKDWHEAAVNSIDVSSSPDKPLMVSGSEDGSAKLVNCATGMLGIKGRLHPSQPVAAQGQRRLVRVKLKKRKPNNSRRALSGEFAPRLLSYMQVSYLLTDSRCSFLLPFLQHCFV